MVPISSLLALLVLFLQCDRVHMYRYIPNSMRSRALPVTVERMDQVRHSSTSTKLAVIGPLSQLIRKVTPGGLSSALRRIKSPGAILVALRSALLVFERLLAWVRTSFASLVTALSRKDKKGSSDEESTFNVPKVKPVIATSESQNATQNEGTGVTSDVTVDAEKPQQQQMAPSSSEGAPRQTAATTEGAGAGAGAAEQPEIKADRKKATKPQEDIVPVYSQLEPSTWFAATGEAPKDKAIRVRDVPIVASSGKEGTVSDEEAKTIAKNIADLYTKEYKF